MSPHWRTAARIDAHNHVHDAQAAGFRDATGRLDREHAHQVLARAQALDIDAVCVSHPLTGDCPDPDQVRRANDVVFAAMDLSDRFLGFCYLNPGYARESVAEIDRCVVQGGMAGIKLYHQYRVCDPALAPVMAHAAELGVPVLVHAGKLRNTRGRSAQPRISDAGHFVRAARQWPDTILIQGHIGGGGDWEWNLRALEASTDCPNLYIDTSGSVVDTGIVDRTVAALGPERVLFATDGGFETGVGKVLDAHLSPAERARVFAGNLQRIFSRRRIP